MGNKCSNRYHRIELYTIVFIFMISSYLAFYAIYRNDLSRLGKSIYYYSLGITPPNSNEYEMYLPVVLESNGSVSDLMSEISGSFSHEIIDTGNGKALKIVGSGKLEINLLYTTTKCDGFPKLSLSEDTWNIPGNSAISNIYLWIYSSKSSIQVSLYFSYNFYTISNSSYRPVEDIADWYYSAYCSTELGWKLIPITLDIISF